MLFVAWNSDRTKERIWHTAIPLFITAAGLSIGSMWPVHGLLSAMLGFMLVGAGIYTFIPSFWAHPSKHLSGTAAAVGVAIINSFGNLGGFVGPYLMGWLETHTHSFVLGHDRAALPADARRRSRVRAAEARAADGLNGYG